MKLKLITLLIAAMGIAAVPGCKSAPIETEKSNNSAIEIEFLFEKDGCKMYRFLDGGDYVYWSNCSGNTQHRVNNPYDKNHHEHKIINVITN